MPAHRLRFDEDSSVSLIGDSNLSMPSESSRDSNYASILSSQESLIIFQPNFCEGYKAFKELNIHTMFPLQLLHYMPNRKWTIDFQRNAFHHIDCFNNHYLLKSNEQIISSQCSDLQYNQELKNIVNRAELTDTSKINHYFMSYEQIKRELNKKNEEINDLKLNGLNLMRNNIRLSNSKSDYKRLINQIANNNIPRVHQIIKSCVDSNYSANSIIDKLNAAINGQLL